ncbi:MAG TPA: ABC transporter substrate-binding protein [Acidimicrobiia bacterium]|nr:ABC transporter substrate-binding protein [Acidimicrobiia bacterium]
MKKSIAFIASLALLVAACAAEEGGGGGDASCEKGDLTLVEEGVLTIGTDEPSFPPWFDFEGGPDTGTGFESAVAYAVADELGFTEEEVNWVVVPFNNAFAPGEKDFDFDINQVSISEERDEAVDFSDGYYDVNQALLAFSDSEIASATTIDELKAYRLGAQVGTTSLDFITDVIQPESEPLVYDTNADAKAAFDAGQLDGLVLDLPTAFFVSAVEIEGSTVVAQFPSAGESEQFGMVFEEGNPLRDCVNQALANVDLEAIQQEWLSDVVEAPIIQTS